MALSREKWVIVRILAIPLLAAATVAVLAVSVFTLSARATIAGQDAAALHLVDETLRSIDAADTLARQMLLLSLVDPDLGLDARTSTGVTMDSFETALSDAESGLAALAEVRGSARSIIDREPFSAALESQVDAVESAQAGEPAEGLRVLVSDVLPALDEARARILDHQSYFVDRLDANTTALRAIAAFVGFIVAFVAPTVAILVYRVVTRPPRQLLRYRARLAAAQERRDDVLAGLERAVEHLDPDRLRLLIRAERGTLVVHQERIDVRSMLDLRAAAHSVPVVWKTSRTEVSTDAPLLDLLLEVVLDLVPADETDGVVVSEGRGRLEISVPLPSDMSPSEYGDLISQRTSAARRSMLQGHDTSLTLALRLADQLGLELLFQAAEGSPTSSTDGHRLVVSIPVVSIDAVPAAPVPASQVVVS